MVKVKICGVTNLQDATWAASLGAEFIGFNFYAKSPRKVSMKMCADVMSKMPPILDAVGVFVDEETEKILQAVKKCTLKYVQLHGKEQPEYLAELKQKAGEAGLEFRIIKAFRIKGSRSLPNLARYTDAADYFLLDTYVEGVEGGTGETFNWEVAAEAKKFGREIFLAGGLMPSNVAESVRQAAPYAVDTASGVERLPRRKDYELLRDFIMAAKSVKV